MKQIKTYSPEQRSEALRRVKLRSADQSLAQVAEACGVNLGTLKSWIKQANREAARSGVHRGADAWTPEEQLRALEATALLSDAERSAWCRERGLFPHHLQAWRQSLTAPRTEESHVLRELRRERDRLEAELLRKDKALAEAAALLVLQKKFHDVLSGGES